VEFAGVIRRRFGGEEIGASAAMPRPRAFVCGPEKEDVRAGDRAAVL